MVLSEIVISSHPNPDQDSKVCLIFLVWVFSSNRLTPWLQKKNVLCLYKNYNKKNKKYNIIGFHVVVRPQVKYNWFS